MKDIRTILNDYEIPEEVREAIAKEVRANYKTIADWQKKADRIAELEEANAAFAEKANALDGKDAENAALKDEIAKWEAKEAERIEGEKRAKAEADFRKSFEEAVGDRKFANDMIADAVFRKTYERCKSETGFAIDKALEEAVKDADGIWVNPQRDPAKMPTKSIISGGEQRTHEEKSFLDALFGPASNKE